MTTSPLRMLLISIACTLALQGCAHDFEDDDDDGDDSSCAFYGTCEKPKTAECALWGNCGDKDKKSGGKTNDATSSGVGGNMGAAVEHKE